jgi:hypothetical protein
MARIDELTIKSLFNTEDWAIEDDAYLARYGLMFGWFQPNARPLNPKGRPLKDQCRQNKFKSMSRHLSTTESSRH